MTINWMQCDCCARMTNRLHRGFWCGIETAACDLCAHYEWEAYDEEPPLFLDEMPDPEEEAYEQRRHDNDWDRSEP